jgi:threonine aldolase
LCFSKSLGAPIGSILLGSREVIDNARHFRKVLGGGWRQAGILAAAALFAMEHHIDRLKEDHLLAKYLAHQLLSLGCHIYRPVQTNMVFVDFSAVGLQVPQLGNELEKCGIRIFNDPGYKTRLVVHLQTPREAVDCLIENIRVIIDNSNLSSSSSPTKNLSCSS